MGCVWVVGRRRLWDVCGWWVGVVCGVYILCVCVCVWWVGVICGGRGGVRCGLWSVCVCVFV